MIHFLGEKPVWDATFEEKKKMGDLQGQDLQPKGGMSTDRPRPVKDYGVELEM